MSIKVLTKEIAQKISAGEVVERPASVVKELIENAIDANSTNITIEIENGGIDYIRVTDNGCGMDEADCVECFKTHATSKIATEEDLYSIKSLGFRGEAIPSISAVSKLTLYSRERGSDFGTKVINECGEIVLHEKSGRPEGTTVIVENIFKNVPARLKFLKKPSSEMAHISNIVQKYILARPDIAFRFISGGKDIFVSSGDGSLKNAIHTIYGGDIYANLIPMEYKSGDIKISGFIGDPTIARATKTMQNLFINGRYVKSEMISNAIKQGYLNRLMFAKHPFFVVNLTLPFSEIDVNVHPNKLEVRFKEEGVVQECFFKAVKAAFENLKVQEPAKLYDSAPLPEKDKTEPFLNIQTPKSEPSSFAVKTNEYSNRKEVQRSLMDIVNENVSFVPEEKKRTEIAAQSSGKIERLFKEVEEENKVNIVNVETKPIDEGLPKSQSELQLSLSNEIGDYRVIGQLFNTYILIEYKDSFLIIDQHAAHERINTNKYMKELEESEVVKQRILTPFVIKLTPDDFNIAMENLSLFDELGFELSEFGDNVIRISTVPQLFGEGNLKEFFMETLDAIRNNPKLDARKDKLFQTACKHSIRAGDRLSDEQIKELIKISMEDKTPLNCPHGRSIVIIKPKKEIEKWFMRIV